MEDLTKAVEGVNKDIYAGMIYAFTGAICTLSCSQCLKVWTGSQSAVQVKCTPQKSFKMNKSATLILRLRAHTVLMNVNDQVETGNWIIVFCTCVLLISLNPGFIPTSVSLQIFPPLAKNSSGMELSLLGANLNKDGIM